MQPPSKTKCPDCDKYAKDSHNYCSMCGYHLTKGYAQYARIAMAYFSNEKFCGYCGKPRNNCHC